MKTVWNVISDNEIMDHPCVQTFASEKDALKMVDELFAMYPSDDHAAVSVENIADGKYFCFTGGDFEEWIYVIECEVVTSSVPAPILDKDF